MKRQALARMSLALAAAAVFSVPVRADETARQPARLSLVSGGKTVLLDEYEPVEAGDHPSALVLHGAGGLLFDGPEMRRVARRLAAGGVRAYVVHYFDGSGVAFTTSDKVLEDHFDGWLAVVRAAVDFVSSKQDAGEHGKPVGIYGYSMGAFLGIAASSDNPEVGALAEQSGGVWNRQLNRLGRMPPTLMVHGSRDRRVPFEEYAVPLETVLDQRGTGCETWFISPDGHGFSPPAQAKAREVIAEFLLRRLSSGKPPAPDGKPGHSRGDKTIQW